MGRRCVACTRRCSFRQAKISEWVVVEWVAAALLTTRPLLTKRPLLSECLPALTAVPAALTKQAKRQSKGLHTRASSHGNLSDLDGVGGQQCSLGNPQASRAVSRHGALG